DVTPRNAPQDKSRIRIPSSSNTYFAKGQSTRRNKQRYAKHHDHGGDINYKLFSAGYWLMSIAVAAGHDITAVVRHPNKLTGRIQDLRVATADLATAKARCDIGPRCAVAPRRTLTWSAPRTTLGEASLLSVSDPDAHEAQPALNLFPAPGTLVA